MSSPATGGLYKALCVLLFSSAAMSLQSPHNASIFIRDEVSTYDAALTDFLANPTCSPGNDTGGDTGGDLMIAVASYINPLADPDAWNRLIGYPNSQMPILIANAVNGPDSAIDTSWQDVIDRASAAGKIVLGYVRTGYLGVSEQAFTTRLGSGVLSDWTAQIEEDVDSWYRLYGNSMGGIFFDEGWPECGDNNEYHDLYKYINDYTKRKHPGAYTVLNPGSPMASCFEDTMDTLLTFELSYSAYTTAYTPNDWTPKDSRKLWHIVYNVPESAIEEVASLARQRGAGFLQLTDDNLPNPYDNLPDDGYMQAQIAQASGGELLNTPASSWSSGPVVGAVPSVAINFFDYSSASLSWEGVQGALGYNIYCNAEVAASVPSSMTSITIGGLNAGTSYAFFVRAIGGGGTEGPQSPTSQTTTTALPGGSTIINLSVSSDSTSSTFKADVLVPYAFVRLYLWDTVSCNFTTDPGWPINFIPSNYVCTQYMVEGTTLYKYDGVVPAGTVNVPFSWTPVESGLEVPVTNRYTYTWTLPLGTSTVDPNKFIVQGQGYNAFTNIFEPDADDYDCKGSSLCDDDLLPLCNAAQSNVIRTNIYTNQGSAADTGTCGADTAGNGCGLFIQGSGDCTISGDDLWSAYAQIQGFGKCGTCGSWHRADGCLVTINYVSGCTDVA